MAACFGNCLLLTTIIYRAVVWIDHVPADITESNISAACESVGVELVQAVKEHDSTWILELTSEEEAAKVLDLRCLS